MIESKVNNMLKWPKTSNKNPVYTHHSKNNNDASCIKEEYHIFLHTINFKNILCRWFKLNGNTSVCNKRAEVTSKTSVAGEPGPQEMHPHQVFCPPGWKLAKKEAHFWEISTRLDRNPGWNVALDFNILDEISCVYVDNKETGFPKEMACKNIRMNIKI